MTSCQTGEYNCPYCTRTFEVRSKLSNHLQRFHNLTLQDSKEIIEQQEADFNSTMENKDTCENNSECNIEDNGQINTSLYRTYKLSNRTCTQIDYLKLITQKEKTEVISSAVEILFLLITKLDSKSKGDLMKISSAKSNEEIFEMIKKHMLQAINESYSEK